MLELTSAGQPVHLTPGTNIQLEYNSPLFDEETIKGSFSYSLNVPAGPNGPLYGWPERPDRTGEPGGVLPAELADDGLPLLTGGQRLKAASATKYAINLQGGLSGANLSGRQLSSFSYGGVRLFLREVPDGLDGAGNPKFDSGLRRHANDVVANPQQYPYVFAPLRNDHVPAGQPAPFDPLDVPPYGSVNNWLPAGAGVPEGFIFATQFLVMGLPPVSGSAPINAYCPFPRLRYVLQCLFEESGLAVDLAELLPGELGELVMVSNAWLVDRGDWTNVGFSLADVVPAMTVGELLAALRADFGAVVYLDPRTRRVRSCYLHERVALASPHRDLSAQLAGAPELTIEEKQGLTLTYHVDEADELTKALLDQQPDPALVLAPVATVADLPAVVRIVDNPQFGQVRLVESRGTYYECKLAYRDAVSVNATWKELPQSFPVVSVQGGGEEQAQHLCYTTTKSTRFYSSTTAPTAPLVAISQPPYQATQTVVPRSSALRLLFYNGLQPADDGVSLYPQLSMQSASSGLSLRLTGPQGTYAHWLKAWLPVRLRGNSYKVSLLLTTLDLARFDLSRQLWLDGVAYLVRKLSATVPLKKAASVELVRL